MTKQEFLEKLRLALNGKVSGAAVTENLRYYEDYINTEIRKGRTEAEVLEALGDPRLLARTIVTAGTNGREQEGSFRNAEEGGRADGVYGSQREQDFAHPKKRIVIPAWVWLIIGLLIVVLVISAVFSVLSFLLPVLIPIAVVLLLVKLFRDWMN